VRAYSPLYYSALWAPIFPVHLQLCIPQVLTLLAY
jgi:hypothetical protein